MAGKSVCDALATLSIILAALLVDALGRRP